MEYNFRDIEKKWQRYWEKSASFKASDKGKKYYVLEMFPYPSGKLHMGHMRNYAIGDCYARYLRMKGYNVLYPMGYDSFGMPAENAAIKNKTNPRTWTSSSIEVMTAQQKKMGLSYDWDRLVITCLPEYYRWNQWFFIQLYKKGLAYKKESPINYCDSCETVLANEQVIDGKCWRCENEVSLRNLSQWFFKITDYAEELLKDIDILPGWPERVRVMQKNWIGKSFGTQVRFPVSGTDLSIDVFTTRPDTLFGVTFMALSPASPLVDMLVKGTEYESRVREFSSRMVIKEKFVSQSEKEKEGIFTGRTAINPVNGDKIPIYVANFVLMEYGTGAIMCVPAHDSRDFLFAKKYSLPVKVVITPKDKKLETAEMTDAYIEPGIMINSGIFDGMDSKEAILKISEFVKEKGYGDRTVKYKLRDWLISRQRYWGTPIPVVYCDKCGAVAENEEKLPVLLPEDVSFTGKGNPLAASKIFKETKCPSCGGPARRETDTMDTFVDSSWYFMRYVSPKSSSAPFDKKEIAYWMPVDQYIGGIEHAILHLMYSRFFTKATRDMGLHKIDEPFKRLLCQGMVIKDGFKMSKSKGNVVSVDDIIDKYGADTARLFILFAAPPENDLDWSDEGVRGSFRFLIRICNLFGGEDISKSSSPLAGEGRVRGGLSPFSDEKTAELQRQMHLTVKKVTADMENFKFNTAISAIMEYVNFLYSFKEKFGSQGKDFQDALLKLLLVLHPFAPHITEELRELSGIEGIIDAMKWPEFDEKKTVSMKTEIAVQVNGKLRGVVLVGTDSEKDIAFQAAASDERIKSYLGDAPPVKLIFIKNRLLNIIVNK